MTDLSLKSKKIDILTSDIFFFKKKTSLIIIKN
jgi:hypothetical protein